MPPSDLAAPPGASPDGRPPYTYLRRGRWWYWEPPAHTGQKAVALGTDRTAAWREARRLNKRLKARGPGSIHALIEGYQQSRLYTDLSPVTQGQYDHYLEVLAGLPVPTGTVGELQARALRPRHADGIYDTLVEKRGGAAAAYATRVARRVWAWGLRQELVDQNPWARMGLKGRPGRTQRWERAQVDQLIATAERLGRPSIALATTLLYWWGWRPQDVLGLTWADIAAGQVVSRKTKTPLPISVTAYPAVAAALARARRVEGEDTVVLNERFGKPWTVNGWSHAFREVATAAGLPSELQARDLRATVATEMEEAGVDAQATSTHTGHATPKMRRHYTRRSQKALETAAKKRLEGG